MAFFGPRKPPGPLRIAYLLITLVAIAILLWQIKRMLGSVEGLTKP